MLAFPSVSYTKKPRTICFDRYQLAPCPFQMLKPIKSSLNQKQKDLIVSKMIIEAQRNKDNHDNNSQQYLTIEAPFILGSKVCLRHKPLVRNIKSAAPSPKKQRPRTVNTVFRSKSCQPSSRRRFEQLKQITQSGNEIEYQILKPCWK